MIWSTRLVELARAAGAGAAAADGRSEDALERGIARADRVIVDLTAHRFDALAVVARAARAGRPVLCAAEHDAADLRRAALAAGATRVLAYRRIAADGLGLLRTWLEPSEGESNGRPPADQR